jgi:hypothetical protein
MYTPDRLILSWFEDYQPTNEAVDEIRNYARALQYAPSDPLNNLGAWHERYSRKGRPTWSSMEGIAQLNPNALSTGIFPTFRDSEQGRALVSRHQRHYHPRNIKNIPIFRVTQNIPEKIVGNPATAIDEMLHFVGAASVFHDFVQGMTRHKSTHEHLNAPPEQFGEYRIDNDSPQSLTSNVVRRALAYQAELVHIIAGRAPTADGASHLSDEHKWLMGEFPLGWASLAKEAKYSPQPNTAPSGISNYSYEKIPHSDTPCVGLIPPIEVNALNMSYILSEPPVLRINQEAKDPPVYSHGGARQFIEDAFPAAIRVHR